MREGKLPLEIGKAYKIGKHAPIYVKKLSFTVNHRWKCYVEGFSIPGGYIDYMKQITFGSRNPPKTIAEIENIPYPPVVGFDFTSASKIEPVELPGWGLES